MGNDPYAAGKLKGDAYAAKSDVVGSLVVVLQGRLEDRGLQLITPPSRALKRYEVHELIITDEQGAKPGTRVNRIAYVGFFSVQQEGVIVAGDEVYLQDQLIGYLVGFDETHLPNHQNIIIRATQRVTGVELNAQLGMKLLFKKP
jgi:hypothetical protein